MKKTTENTTNNRTGAINRTSKINRTSTVAAKQNQKVPALRFPEFDGEWSEKKIGEAFQVTAGGDIAKENVSQKKTNVFKYPIYANAKENKGFYAYSDIYKIEPSVITVAGRGVNIGVAHAREHRFYPIVRLLVLKPRKDQNINFFEHRINRINLFVESTGVPQLTAPQISGYKIRYPEPPEQQKIADFLTAVDQRIALLEKKKANLEQYKKSVMQKIFSQEIRFKDEKGESFPDWEEKKIKDLFDGIKGKGLSKDKLVENGKYKCILYGELYTTYKELISEIKSFTNDKEGVLSKTGDLLVPCSTTTSGIDLANVTALNENNVLLGGDMTIMRAKQAADNVYFAYYLSNFKKYEIAKFGQGITIVHLYFSHFKELSIQVPSLAEQQKIAAFLSFIDKQLERVEKQIEKCKGFKKGLLQKMFV